MAVVLNKVKYLVVFFIVFHLSCTNSVSHITCKKIGLNDEDFTEIVFKDLPDTIKNEIIQLATKRKQMDTAYSLDNGTIYSYHV